MLHRRATLDAAATPEHALERGCDRPGLIVDAQLAARDVAQTVGHVTDPD